MQPVFAYTLHPRLAFCKNVAKRKPRKVQNAHLGRVLRGESKVNYTGWKPNKLIAQGIRPGCTNWQKQDALQGQKHWLLTLLPLQGVWLFGNFYPGRVPWAMCFCPFGACCLNFWHTLFFRKHKVWKRSTIYSKNYTVVFHDGNVGRKYAILSASAQYAKHQCVTTNFRFSARRISYSTSRLGMFRASEHA